MSEGFSQSHPLEALLNDEASDGTPKMTVSQFETHLKEVIDVRAESYFNVLVFGQNSHCK